MFPNNWKATARSRHPSVPQPVLPGASQLLHPCEAGAAWEDLRRPEWDIDGVVWFRKKIEIPQEWAGRPLTLQMGNIDDVDTTYFNGVQVGTTEGWEKPRSYTVPADQVKRMGTGGAI